MSTAIEWADVAHSVVRGCSRESAGCDNCYSARMDGTRQKHRTFTDSGGRTFSMGELVKIFPGKPKLGKRGQALKAREASRYAFNGKVLLDPAALRAGLDLPRVHDGKAGYSVFWNHRSDTFHEALTNEEIAAQFGVMASRPDIQFLVLTKRAKRMREWFEWFDKRCKQVFGTGPIGSSWGVVLQLALSSVKISALIPGRWPLPNVRLGVSAENQETADERIPELLATPAAGHFVSLEPMLGPIDLDPAWCPIGCTQRYGAGDDGVFCEHCGTELAYQGWLDGGKQGPIDWIIVGAESGPHARPAELDWVRSVRDQVLAARDGRAVPDPGDPHLFIKQVDVCDRCGGDGWARNAYGDPLNGAIKGARHAEVRCSTCAGTGLAGKVRKGNPAIDGRRWEEVPR